MVWRTDGRASDGAMKYVCLAGQASVKVANHNLFNSFHSLSLRFFMKFCVAPPAAASDDDGSTDFISDKPRSISHYRSDRPLSRQFF